VRASRRLFLAAGLAGAAAVVLAQKAPRVIRISAKRFSYTPSRIEIARGEPVVFELTSEDIFMGFSIPDFNLRADIVPGKSTQVPLTPDRAGTFTFLCDVFCGEGHEGMNGTLVVT
jgi:cytochrome c oxidase subunit II